MGHTWIPRVHPPPHQEVSCDASLRRPPPTAMISHLESSAA
jgi:hypothetical protein